MSTFVELAATEYNPSAFSAFDPGATGFTIGNARALMWMSQLAYETGKPKTITTVGELWGFKAVTPFIQHKIGVPASFDTCGIIGERPDAIMLAFAGTDPAVWETLATDVNFLPTPETNTHAGFQAALDAVTAEIERAIEKSKSSGKPLFIAGHSLGAALAALAARFADRKGAKPRAVYGFGMPRVGGEQFQADYNASLGPLTFRLVHGLDIVARIPRSGLGFRHVGRELHCDSGNRFDPFAPLSAVGSDTPAFAPELLNIFLAGIQGVLAGHILSPTGPGTFGPLFKFLPKPIRDHLQDRYYTALSP
jgi:triacylglycerol lipase